MFSLHLAAAICPRLRRSGIDVLHQRVEGNAVSGDLVQKDDGIYRRAECAVDGSDDEGIARF